MADSGATLFVDYVSEGSRAVIALCDTVGFEYTAVEVCLGLNASIRPKSRGPDYARSAAMSETWMGL